MIKKIVMIFLIFFIVSLMFAQQFAKPVNIIPAREGNFEVITGGMVDTPIDMDRFLSVASRGARHHGWRVLGQDSGVIRLRLEKRDWWVEMNICYWEDEYWYEYQDSWNLDANPEKNKIHRNYTRWIANIEKQIYENY